MSKEALMGIEPRRVQRLLVSPERLLELLKLPTDGSVIDGMRLRYTRDAIPENAKVIRCSVDPYSGAISMVLEDESFPEIEDGHTIPIFCPAITSEPA